MSRTLLAILRRLGFDYTWFRIYRLLLDDSVADRPAPTLAGYRCCEVTPADLERSPIEDIRSCSNYAGPGAHLFGVIRADGVLASVQCVWFGARYTNVAFWPVEPQAAVSMHLVTDPAERDKGLATLLKKYSAQQLRAKGFSSIYSRIWWTNIASIRVSEKAGWKRVGTVVEVKLPALRRPLRIASPRP
jgi:GNAT superfamily N-acetyltransferase